MKKLVCVSLIALGLVSIALAQSGRRVRTPFPESTSPTERKEANTTEKPASGEFTGYSESAPNQAVSIYIDRQNRRNKNKKREEKPQSAAATEKIPTSAKTSDDDDVLRINTKLISIPVTVANKNGGYVPSLSQGNFQIFEDGKEQEIAYFGTTDKPFTAILLLDVSGSTSLKIDQIQNGAIAFINQMLPQDRAAVISFDGSVRTLIDFSSDKKALETAIRRIRFGGGTALYDAVYDSLRKYLTRIEGKKAIVLFTDGVDNNSVRGTYESTVMDSIESEAVIFPIYLNTFLDAIGVGGGNGPMTSSPSLGIPGISVGQRQIEAVKVEYARGRRYLQDLANATGGRVYLPDASKNGLNAAFEAIAEELRSQYEVGYYSNSEGNPGDIKKIKIRINRPNLVIRSRDSYVVE